MRHGHGITGDQPKDKRRRATQPQRDMDKAERDRQRAQGGGSPNELGVTQGQNAEQGNTVDPGNAKESGEIRH